MHTGWGNQIRKKTFDDVYMPFIDEPVYTAQSCVIGMRRHVIWAGLLDVATPSLDDALELKAGPRARTYNLLLLHLAQHLASPFLQGVTTRQG